MDKRKVVFIIGSMRRGGAERVISILANNYEQEGYEVDILTLLDADNDYALNESIRVIPIFKEGSSRIKQLPYWICSIRAYVKAQRPEKIISFIARINIITILACIGLKQSIIVSERNDPSKDGRGIGVKIATYILYPLAETIVFQTKRAKQNFPNIIRKKSVIIPNPIQVVTTEKKSKKNKIVAVGRLEEQKNHKMLVSAFKKVNNKFPDYELVIYGEGSLRKELEAQIKELSLEKSILLPGNVINIHDEIMDSKIFVLSSDYEGLSNALLEAMMLGIACISTDCAGSDEIINNNENGIIIPVGEEEKLVLAMEELITNDVNRMQIEERAKESVEFLEIKNIIHKWNEIITYK